MSQESPRPARFARRASGAEPIGERLARMTRLLLVGRLLFSLGVIGLGATHFVFQRFATGRAPAWPASLPGEPVWAYGSGVMVIAMGAAIIAHRHARFASLVAAAMIFVWALLRHIPVLVSVPFLAAPWTPAGKALVFVSGALLMAATSPAIGGRRGTRFLRFVNARDPFVVSARVSLGLFFLITGTQHFLFTPFVASLIPAWFPGDPVFWTRFGGMALLAGGAGLLVPRSAPLAALLSGVMVFSWFWIIHVPRTLGSVSDGIAVFEALAVAGIAFVLAGYLAPIRRPHEGSPADRDAERAEVSALHIT